jgi:hypothetical protein
MFLAGGTWQRNWGGEGAAAASKSGGKLVSVRLSSCGTLFGTYSSRGSTSTRGQYCSPRDTSWEGLSCSNGNTGVSAETIASRHDWLLDRCVHLKYYSLLLILRAAINIQQNRI